jgi:hypothetical protein
MLNVIFKFIFYSFWNNIRSFQKLAKHRGLGGRAKPPWSTTFTGATAVGTATPATAMAMAVRVSVFPKNRNFFL